MSTEHSRTADLVVVATSLSSPTLTFVRDHIRSVSPILDTVVLTEEKVAPKILAGERYISVARGRRPLASLQSRRANLRPYWAKDRRLERALSNPVVASAESFHVHFASDAARYLSNLKPRTSRRVFVTFHGYDVDPLAATDPDYVAVLNQVMEKHRATALFVSEALESRAKQLGIRPAKSMVLYLGVDVLNVPARTPLTTPSGPSRIVSVGSLRPKKNHEQTIEAFAALVDGVEAPYELLIAGEGALRPKLESLIGSLGLQGAVQLLGWTSPEATFRLLKSASCFVMASRGDTGDGREGLPIALLEAMAVGLPVVGTRHSGIPEALTDAPQAVLVDENDVEALAAGIDEALSLPFGTLNRSFTKKRFDSPRQMEQLVALYNGASVVSA